MVEKWEALSRSYWNGFSKVGGVTRRKCKVGRNKLAGGVKSEA